MITNHLIVDASECNKRKLNDINLIRHLLTSLPSKIDMELIPSSNGSYIAPSIINYEHRDPMESGITGFALIVTSHLSIHTYPKKGKFFFDTFSCKPFNPEIVTNYLRTLFDVKEMRVQKLIRDGILISQKISNH